MAKGKTRTTSKENKAKGTSDANTEKKIVQPAGGTAAQNTRSAKSAKLSQSILINIILFLNVTLSLLESIPIDDLDDEFYQHLQRRMFSPPIKSNVKELDNFAVSIELIEYLFWKVEVSDVQAVAIVVSKMSGRQLNTRPVLWVGEPLFNLLAEQHSPRAAVIATILVKHGVDPKISQFITGTTCMMRSAESDSMALSHIFASPHETRYLINRRDTHGRTALFYAAQNSAYSSMKGLLQSGININQQDEFGDTAIHWAIRRDDQVSVEILLDAGADVGISNNVFVDPIVEAFDGGNRQLIALIVESRAYEKSMLSVGATRARFTRITQAFDMALPESVILRLLEPEFGTLDTTLCRLRDNQGRNVIAMAVDLRYPAVLEKLLDYYHQAYSARLPLWQQCSPHEPADGNVFPVEKFLKSHGTFRRNTRLLRRLMASLVPVDGSSFLMQALRVKGPEFILENFIPYGDPEVTLRDLQLHAKERGAETWDHNALTLASEIGGAAGQTILNGIVNLISIGVLEGIPEASQALIQGLATAAKLGEASLIQAIALEAPLAVQDWYCHFKHMTALDVRQSSFVSSSLPLNFAGFNPRREGPLVCQVKPVLDQVEPLNVIDMRAVETLMRSPAARFNPGLHIKAALRLVALKRSPELRKPHPSLATILRSGGVTPVKDILYLQNKEHKELLYQRALNDSDILHLLKQGLSPQAIANLFPHAKITLQRRTVQRFLVDWLILKLRNWLWNTETTEKEDMEELNRQECALQNRRKRGLQRWKQEMKEGKIAAFRETKLDSKFWVPPYTPST